MKILALAASNSKNSINKQLVSYATSLIYNKDLNLIDLNDYEMPIYSEDREKETGIPELAKRFYQHITEADTIIISYAEHNGTYSAAFKNLFDWTSRINMKVYQNKSMIILATSPGAGGAKNVLNSALNSAPHFGANVIGTLSVPKFYENFDNETGILINEALNDELQTIVNKLSSVNILLN